MDSRWLSISTGAETVASFPGFPSSFPSLAVREKRAVVKPGTMEMEMEMETETEMEMEMEIEMELRVHVQRQGLRSLATSLELCRQLPVLRRRLREGPAR